MCVQMYTLICTHTYTHPIYTYPHAYLPHTYVQGAKVIGLSICHCRRYCCCPQKTGIFKDLQVQASHEWHKTVQTVENLTYLCLYLLLTIHECDKL